MDSIGLPSRYEQVRRGVAYVAAHRKALSTSFINQIVSSATNFLLGFVLVRVLTPADYGSYGIGLSVSYLYAGVGNALFLTQMVVHMPEKPEKDRLPYAARVLVAMLLFCAASVVVVGCCIAIGSLALPTVRGQFANVLAVSGCAVSYLLKEFFVRFAYTDRDEGRAVIIACSIAGAVFGMLGVLWWTGTCIGMPGALWLFAGAQIVGAGVGAFLTRLPLRNTQLGPVRDDMVECWRVGRWALGGVAVTWIQVQAYMYVAVAGVGAEGVGRANAARLLVSPFLLLIPAFSQVTMPRFAEMRAHAPDQMRRAGRFTTGALVVVALLYSAALLAVSESLVPAVLGPKYSDMRNLIAAWCIVVVLTVVRDGASTLLQVLKRFRVLTLTNALSAVVTVGAAVAFMSCLGVAGSVLGATAGEFVLAVILWRLVRDGPAPVS